MPPANDEFSPRLLELVAEVGLDPYPVTASISIDPPDKNRAATISATQTAYVIARNQLEAMTQPLPDPAAEDGILRDDQGAPVMPKLDQAVLKRLEELVQTAAVEYDKALFGPAYDAVMARFANEQGAVWNAFYRDVSDYFMPLPDGEKCPTCGHVKDEDAEGNDDESSTSLRSIGTK